jgi:hypothetical protein
MKEEQERRDINFKRYFSPTFIYNLRPNKPQPGMYLSDALNIVKNYGIVPERSYPYDYDDAPDIVSDRIWTKASNYKIRNYARIVTMHELKYALIESGPCPIAFPVYKIEGHIWDSEGKLPLLGYHAMTIVGWTLEGFILRNSWGTRWGDKGYSIYPYSNWGSHCEIWTAYDDRSMSNSSDISMTKWSRFIRYILNKLM